MQSRDVVVIGAGFGGLSAALTLAERGIAVAVVEALPYSGGCASTFRRHGVGYEAGATLFSGLAPATAAHPGGFFTRALARHGRSVDVDFADPVIEHRVVGAKDDLVVDGVRDRAAFVASLCRGASENEAQGVRRFMARQQKVADLLWPVLDGDDRLPFVTRSAARSFGFHAARAFAYSSALPTLWSLQGKSLRAVLQDDGVADFAPLRSWCESLCQIAVQCSADDADALFALCSLDYVWRGTGHVRGGIGVLAQALEDCIKDAGGEVFLARKARGVRRDGERFVVDTGAGPLSARRLLLNLLPADAARLLGVSLPAHLAVRQGEVDNAWGAVMLYLVARAPVGTSPEPRHIDLVVKQSDGADHFDGLVEGHHIFVSVGSQDEGRLDADEMAAFGQGDLRTATVSTHIALAHLRDDDDAGAARVHEVQQRMARAVSLALSGWEVLRTTPASPRTFARYTGRSGGAVGGVPRRAGLTAWLDGAFSKNEVVAGAALIGDSVFPGQSTLGVAVGGARAAHRLADLLGH